MVKFDFNDCIDHGDGFFVCRRKADIKTEQPKDLGITGDISKAVLIATVPILTKDEAKFVETSFSNILIGSIITGVSIALGFFIYEIISVIGVPIFTEDPLINSLIIVLILILIISFLAFVQFRITKALTSTNILERFAVNDNLNFNTQKDFVEQNKTKIEDVIK